MPRNLSARNKQPRVTMKFASFFLRFVKLKFIYDKILKSAKYVYSNFFILTEYCFMHISAYSDFRVIFVSCLVKCHKIAMNIKRKI